MRHHHAAKENVFKNNSFPGKFGDAILFLDIPRYDKNSLY